ncbi:uncharacterized protein LOC132469111 isoform X3 [Gadus macrocephalus]|uniref:uncharacterized protein LOC132469111 isoform X3 n=1 Tax=Gadus macrocephalus TaxID=80720 RepID=UPI0028CB6E72|nr:uncharacterized protein LOC132469111 isoform X3 [Gadus macrocephalus]
MLSYWARICIGLTMMLQATNGQTGITPDPSGPPEVTSGSSMTYSTNVSSNTSVSPYSVTTSTTSSPPLTISPNQTNASTNGSKTTAAPSLVTNSTTSFSRLTISPSRTNASTNGSLNTTAAPSLMTNSTTTTGLTNITAIAGNTFSCASDPPLCCLGLDNSCSRVCFCDVACLRIGDCCSDFNATCITGFPTSQPNLTNTTSTNETTFPIFSFSGSCSANSSMCCSGNNPSCFNGCFCDESCASQTIPDCCPDYNVTCMKATNGTNPTLTTASPEIVPRTPPGPSQTNASVNGSLNTTAAPSLGLTPDPSGPPEVTSGSSMTASTNVSSNTSAAPSLVTNSTTSFSRLTISPSRTNASTNGSLNTTAAPSLMTNSTTTTGLTNITAIAGNTFSCASDPPLCCLGLDNSCSRVCFCDVACLRIGDCCSDFNATCITGFPTSQPNLTNTTSTNETTFPIFSFSGSCSANSSMCCSGNNPSCFNGCFCDESCASQTIPDCCPDYNVTCMKATNGTNPTLTTASPETVPRTPPDPLKLIFALSVSFLAPASYSNSTIQAAVEQAIRALLETTGIDLSYKVLKIQIK